jgi:predicted nucleic acid-binding protein
MEGGKGGGEASPSVARPSLILMLCDTTILIHLAGQRGRRPRERAEAFLQAHLDAPLYTSRICWSEFAEGCATAAEVRSALERFAVVEISELVAWEASRISRTLGRAGLPIGDNDVWVAASALTYRLPLVSRSGRHFARVPGLEIFSYH